MTHETDAQRMIAQLERAVEEHFGERTLPQTKAKAKAEGKLTIDLGGVVRVDLRRDEKTGAVLAQAHLVGHTSMALPISQTRAAVLDVLAIVRGSLDRKLQEIEARRDVIRDVETTLYHRPGWRPVIPPPRSSRRREEPSIASQRFDYDDI